MTAFPSPNMMMVRRPKSENEIRQEVTHDLNAKIWGVTQEDIDRVTTQRMADEMARQESFAEYLINIRNLNGTAQ